MSFTPYLNLETPAHGAYGNSWEIPANANFDAIDAAFHGTRSDGAGTGHIHDGADGQGPQIDHVDLLNKGTNTHAQIDTHIADSSVHFTAASVSLEVSDKNAGGTGDTVDVTPVTDLRIRGARSITSLGGGAVLIDVSAVSGTTGPGSGVPSHLPSTSAPVAVTDYMNAQALNPLSAGNWFVTAPQNVELLMSPEGARLSQDTSQGGVAIGNIVNRIKSQVPHSEVQRVTLYLCRVGTDAFVNDTNRFMIELALMSSVYSSVNLPSRLGFFLRIEVYKTGGSIKMDRTLFAVPTVSAAGLSQVSTLWADSNPVSLSTPMHYQGVHEFSLDRNHAFHYSYNNGPVNIGAAGMAGAATPFVSSLRASLAQEPALLALGQLTPASQVGVAPYYGRFGFDVSWVIGDATTAESAGKVDATIEYFTATSTDDESTPYYTVLPQDDCEAIEPTQPHEPCCDLNPVASIGDIISVTVPVPIGGIPGGNPGGAGGGAGGGGGGGEGGGSGGGGEPVIASFRLIQRFGDGDPTYDHAGFKLRRVGHESDPAEPTYIAFCDMPSVIAIEIINPPRPGTRDACFRLSGDRLPSFIGRPVFYPVSSSAQLDINLPSVPGAAFFARPIPYPVPARPNALFSGDPVDPATAAAGDWPDTLAVDDSVVTNIRWFRDQGTGDLVVMFDVADGLPYGAALNFKIPYLIDPGDEIVWTDPAYTNLEATLILHPPQPEWVSVKMFQHAADGQWERITEITDLTTTYIVAYGKKLPLPVDTDPITPTRWTGFPVDVLDTGLAGSVTDKYQLVDLSTGQIATGVTLMQADLWKGWYSPDLDDLGTVDAFPPDGLASQSDLGETLFLCLSFTESLAGKYLALRAVETADPAMPPADLAFDAIAQATPIIYGVTVTPDTDVGTLRTVTVTGRGFSDVAVTTSTPGTASTIASVTTVSDTEVTFTATLVAAGTATFRLTNYAGDGPYAAVSIVVDSALVPAITTITPDPLTEGTSAQLLTVAGTASTFDPGAVLTLTPSVLVTINVHSVALTTGVLNRFEARIDVPTNGGASYDITATVTNPNGSTDSMIVGVSPPTTPTLDALTFYTEDDYGTTVNAQGKERGARGYLKLTGTNFRLGGVVTTDVPEMVNIITILHVSATETKVLYEIAETATLGTTVTVTYTDASGVVTISDYTTFAIESHTPLITTVNVANPYEGAGHASAPAGSAKVFIAGKHFFEDGASAITNVTVSSPASLTYPGDVSVVDDNLIVIKKLVISGSSVGQTVTITVTVDSAYGPAKTATYEFTVLDQPGPQVTGWHVKPAAGADPLDPIVVEFSSLNYVIDLFGVALSSNVSAAVVVVDGTTISDPGTISANKIRIENVDFPASGATTDPTAYARLSMMGGGSVDIPLLTLVTVTGTPTITTVETFDVVESTRGGSIIITGTDLGATNVASVTLEVVDATLLSFTMAPTTGTEPIATTILSQTSTEIVLGVNAADLVGMDGGILEFAPKFYAPDGSDVSDVGWTDTVTVAAFPDRPKFDDPVTAITTTAGSTNTDWSTPLTVSDGGEYLEIVRYADRSAGATTNLNFNSTDQRITRTIGSWTTDGFRAGDYVVVSNAEDERHNGTYRILTIGGGGTQLNIAVAATPAGYPAYKNDLVVTNATDTTATVALSPLVYHTKIYVATPNTVKATFTNPALAGEDVEIRLISADGRVLDYRKYTTT